MCPIIIQCVIRQETNTSISTFVLNLQIFEWCNYVKMTGLMKGGLPFELSFHDETALPQSVVKSEFIVSNEDLRHMEQVYRKDVPELQSAISLFQMEQEKARKERRLKTFPNSLLNWKPEAGQMEPQCEAALTALREGLQPTALMLLQHRSDTKQHSHDLLYISRQHPTKTPSIICFLFEGLLKFGVIEQIFKHSFVSKEFIWVAVRLFEREKFDSQCGLWWAEESTQQQILIPLPKVSHPLTTAVENSIIWFLDVP